MSAPSVNDPVLQVALRDLMRAHAPAAKLMAAVGQKIVSISPENDNSEVLCSDLIPPDDWLDHGDLAWITRDGALLGLLWSEDTPVPPKAVEVLTWLLSAASSQGANREADMLVTQFPVPTAWLSNDMEFRQVSLTFLDLFGMQSSEILGKTVAEVFSEGHSIVTQLEGAIAGRTTEMQDELLPPRNSGMASPKNGAGNLANALSAGRWIRGQAKPFFGGAANGVLWSVQDVSPEYSRAGQVSALLDTDTPIALVQKDGSVVQISRGLQSIVGLAEEGDKADKTLHLQKWPCFTEQGQQAVMELLQAAAENHNSRADLSLVVGGHLSLSARQSLFAPELLILEGPQINTDAQMSGAVVSQVLSLSDAATVLLDHAGRTQLISDQAAKLLGIDAGQLIGLSLTRIMEQIGMKMHTPTGKPIPMPELKELELPFTNEVLMLLPGGAARHMEIRLSTVDATTHGNKPGMLLTLRDITTLRRTQAKLRHDAAHDTLTGLLNRSGLRAILNNLGGGQPADKGAKASKSNKTSSKASGKGASKAAAEAAEGKTEGSVCLLDIDGFGALNAALGRTAGDLLLIQVAARLNDLASAHAGQAARLADDSFAVYLSGVNTQVSVQKIQAVLREPLRAGRRLVPMTFSIGAAAVNLASPELAMADGEVALQHSKRKGRSQATLFEPRLRDAEAQSFELEEELRSLIEHNKTSEQFSLLYQPTISLKDGQPLGAEALLRWTHPTYGSVSPARFLPIASRSDLINAISEWVVREALSGRQAVRSGSNIRDWRTSVNLSLEELRRAGAREFLLPLINKHNALDIEVSAESLIDHSDETMELLGALIEKGARLIVDDFGDSSSSLTSLTQFPLRGLKLHRTITSCLPNDPKAMKLVEGTIRLAHSLNLFVTAVGVENYAQLDVLRDLGCDAAQGYAITPPLSASDLITWIKNR